MMIHEITPLVEPNKARKRVGRGRGSGHGKTAGRGHKGARSRAGWRRKASYEGGQMPYFRRIPKRGFSNEVFRERFHVVNVALLEKRFNSGDEVNAQTLADARIVRDASLPIKILGNGVLSKSLRITAAKVSESAQQKIEQAGGSVEIVVKKKWVRPRTKKG